MRKKNVSALLMLISLVTSFEAVGKGVINPHEDEEVYTTITATTDYIWRGFSQTTHRPALQGEFNLTIPKSPLTGLYANLWFSNVRFREDNKSNGSHSEAAMNDASDTSNMSAFSAQQATSDSSPTDGPEQAFMEFDTSIGVSNSLGKNASYDLWFVRYLYPGTTKLNYNEYMGEFNLFFLTALVGYTSNVYATGGKALYYNIGFNYQIPESIIKLKSLYIRGGFGHYQLPLVSEEPNYNDYSFEIENTFKNFGLSVMWTNTNDRSRPYGGNRISLAISAFL
ncbi:MAG: hypothetical protein H0U70_02460 [Tatlockia sp.]|nr:hypothetical protein [Tatlockia sp.]